MIPKIIHYCWFGGKPLSDLAIKCIASWKKYFPEYEIREWNEKNFDVNCCAYVREAYRAKKWAFVSDYARFSILYKCGGLYFDTDVEVIKNMDDIIEKGAFMGCETTDKCAPGLGLGVNAGLELYKEILDDYNSSHFLNNDGNCNYITVVDRITNILKKYGFEGTEKIIKIKEVYLYPTEYFCPMDYATGKLYITQNTRSIHWYEASWLDERMKKRRYRCEMIRNRFDGNFGKIASKIYMTGSYYWGWICDGDFKMIKQKISNKFKNE